MGSRTEVKKPTCRQCPDYVHCSGTPPHQLQGIGAVIGDRFCLAGKKPRRFRRGDPTVYVPSWCPKRKTPCEMRAYGFRSGRDFLYHDTLSNQMGRAIAPLGRRYAVKYDLHTDLTPSEFWKRCRGESDASLLHVAVHRYHVVEIDDGLKPVCFYKTNEGYRIEPLFDAQSAKKEMTGGAD